MRKTYTEPLIELRKYSIYSDSVTTSDPENKGDNDLFKDDEVDFFK